MAKMRFYVMFVITVAIVTVTTAQQFAYVPVPASSCERPDTMNTLKGEKGDTGRPGKRGATGIAGKGAKGSKGETPQQIDLQEIWNVVTTANENIRGLTEKNVQLEENMSRLQQENAELKGVVTKVENNTNILIDRVTNNTARLDKLDAPHDCQELLAKGFTQSGVYEIANPSSLGETIQVYCDQLTDGGGWTVFQRRLDGSVDFFRDWREYVNGFGNAGGNYWIGLEHLHKLTSSKAVKLRVELKDFDDNVAYAEYSMFSVAPSSDHYRLTVSGYSGDAGDSLTYHNGMQFTTKDADHDTRSDNCATAKTGAWWYKRCHYSNLNGHYYTSARSGDDGVTWYHWKNRHISLKETKMMIRV